MLTATPAAPRPIAQAQTDLGFEAADLARASGFLSLSDAIEAERRRVAPKAPRNRETQARHVTACNGTQWHVTARNDM